LNFGLPVVVHLCVKSQVSGLAGDLGGVSLHAILPPAASTEDRDQLQNSSLARPRLQACDCLRLGSSQAGTGRRPSALGSGGHCSPGVKTPSPLPEPVEFAGQRLRPHALDVDALVLLMSIVDRRDISLEGAFRAKETHNESRVSV